MYRKLFPALAVSLIAVFTGLQALACDPQMQKFPRDCAIQDRLVRVRAQLQRKGVDINEISEYRALRFIDRYSWEMAKRSRKAPMSVYDPAPITWEIWDRGIRHIFAAPDFKGILDRNLKLDERLVSEVNRVLLTDGTGSIKDPNTDQTKQPGEYRRDRDRAVGFCIPKEMDAARDITASAQSVRRFQQSWEQKAGVPFTEVVQRLGGVNPAAASLLAPLEHHPTLTGGACISGKGWVFYSPSAEVPQQMSWIQVFVQANLDLYRQNQALISPMELAAFVQKWLVTLHPFSDGNGRTSRGVQDILLAHFDLPFAPGGDLQNDALADFQVYLNENYTRTENMLSVLENCARTVNYARPAPANRPRPAACATVAELNGRLPYDPVVVP